jgi:hypothetical protein
MYYLVVLERNITYFAGRVLQQATVKVELGSFKELSTVVCLMCTYFP